MELDLINNEGYIYGGAVYKYADKTLPCVCDPVELRKVDNSCRSGGVYFRFISDSPSVTINVLTSDYIDGNYPHFGVSCQFGIAYAYRNIGEDQWYNLGCNYGRKDIELNEKIEMHRYYDKKYEMIIYSPALCYLKKLSVTLNEGSIIEKNNEINKNILFIGGKNTKGIGITSNAFSLGSIYSRKTNNNVYSLGFESKDYLSMAKDSVPLLKGLQKKFERVFMEITPENASADSYKKELSAAVCELYSLSGRLILWNKPCQDKPLNSDYEKIINEIVGSYSNGVVFINNFGLLKNNKDVDKYTYSDNFINDYGINLLYERLRWNI